MQDSTPEEALSDTSNSSEDDVQFNALLGQPNRWKPTILIANDNALTLYALKMEFRQFFAVVTADNGLEALKAVQD